MDYNIKQVKKHDWKLYKKIRLETLQNEPQAFSSTYKDALIFPDSRWKELLNDKNSVYALILKETNAIGVGRITFKDPEELPDVAVLGGIYIDTLHRKLGLGQKLIEYLITIAKQRKNIKTIKLAVRDTQLRAIKLYTKLGFVKVGENKNEIVMKKTLK